MSYQLPNPEAKPPKLDPSRVPENLRQAIPLAEKYGVTDDGYRQQLFQTLDESDFDLLRRLIREHDDNLDDWLAGPESEGPSFSNEYIVFSALRMLADMA